METLPTPLLLEYPVKKSMYNNSLCKYVVKTFPDGLYSLRSNFLDELARKRLLRTLAGLTVLVSKNAAVNCSILNTVRENKTSRILIYIFDVMKRSHGAKKFTDNKFISGTLHFSAN